MRLQKLILCVWFCVPLIPFSEAYAGLFGHRGGGGGGNCANGQCSGGDCANGQCSRPASHSENSNTVTRTRTKLFSRHQESGGSSGGERVMHGGNAFITCPHCGYSGYVFVPNLSGTTSMNDCKCCDKCTGKSDCPCNCEKCTCTSKRPDGMKKKEAKKETTAKPPAEK